MNNCTIATIGYWKIFAARQRTAVFRGESTGKDDKPGILDRLFFYKLPDDHAVGLGPVDRAFAVGGDGFADALSCRVGS